MRVIYIALRDFDSSSWIPVAKVQKKNDLYSLIYTRGAARLRGFEGFFRMRDLGCEFYSSDIFPILKNRLLSKGRPEYGVYKEWMGRSRDDSDVFEELARTGGLRGTDDIELIPVPEKTSDGRYEAYFFSHGLRHLDKSNVEAVNSVPTGARVFLARDVQNSHDRFALLLRVEDPRTVLGYVPRYYSQAFSSLLDIDSESVDVTVFRVNKGAPPAFRVLCKLSAPWSSGFDPCGQDLYRPLVDSPNVVNVYF